MRAAIALALAATLTGCCCGGKALEKQAYAQVPLTLAEAKQLQKDGATVTVTEKTKSTGGSACGHSPVCLIVLPIILVQAVFPEKWDEVVVMQADGTVTLVAGYDKRGSLLHAQHLVEGELRETRSLELKELGTQAYVDSARLVPQPDGGLDRVPLKLSAQHDFVADERKLLATLKDPKRRANVVEEAWLFLEDEGLAFARERLAAADEPDEAKAELVKRHCETPGFPPLLEDAAKAPGPWTVLRLASCPAGPQREVMRTRLVSLACEGSTEKRLLAEFAPVLTEARGPGVEALVEARARCPAGPRRTLVGLWLGQPVTGPELDGLLASELTVEAEGALDPREPRQRAAMVKLVVDRRGTELGLKRLAEAQVVLEPAELDGLARWYLDPSGFFNTPARGSVLDLFAFAARAADGPARTQAARATLARAKSEPLVAAARAALGDRSQLAVAARGLVEPLNENHPSIERDLVGYGLWRGGCSWRELSEVARRKRTALVCARE